jgi:hypothetical protein
MLLSDRHPEPSFFFWTGQRVFRLIGVGVSISGALFILSMLGLSVLMVLEKN